MCPYSELMPEVELKCRRRNKHFLVAARHGPLVVLLREHRADETDDRSAVGKMPTTSVRLRISRLRRSCGLLLQIWRQCSLGKVANASTSCVASASMSEASLKRSLIWVTTRACWARTAARSGWAKIERTSAPTKSWADLGARVNRLRVKWVRQRCHTAPSKTEPMASVRPAWEQRRAVGLGENRSLLG